MHDSLVMAALQQLSDEDAARHLVEAEAFNAMLRPLLSAHSDVVTELRLQAIARRYPVVGPVDPTWRVWLAWSQAAELQRSLASFEDGAD